MTKVPSKQSDDATQKGAPVDYTGFEAPSRSEEPSKDKLLKPEKQKAPETKAMPRQKAPRLNASTDKKLRRSWRSSRRTKSRQFGLTLKTWPAESPKNTAAQGLFLLIDSCRSNHIQTFKHLLLLCDI